MNHMLSVLPYGVGNERARSEWDVARLRSMTKATLLPEDTRKQLIGSIIRRAREVANLTPPQLGDRVGRTRGTVNDWESGKSSPSLVDLGPLCVALNVDPRVFVELPAMPPDPLVAYLLPPAEVLTIVDEAVPTAETEAGQSERKPTPLHRRARRHRVEDPQ